MKVAPATSGESPRAESLRNSLRKVFSRIFFTQKYSLRIYYKCPRADNLGYFRKYLRTFLGNIFEYFEHILMREKFKNILVLTIRDSSECRDKKVVADNCQTNEHVGCHQDVDNHLKL